MWENLYKEKEQNSSKGKLLKQKTQIIQALLGEEKATIPDLAQIVGQSVPTTTKFINELLEKKIVIECGKLDTKSGRSPLLYCVNKNSGYLVSVEILLKTIRVGVQNLKNEIIHLYEDKDFLLINNQTCLDSILDLVGEQIKLSKVSVKKIIGIGIGITGRVKKQSGDSYSFFNFSDIPLAKIFENKFSIPCFIENDTRTIALGETVTGTIQSNTETFYVNMSRGLGLAIFSNNNLIVGKSGFAGEFGHIMVNPKGKLCICGKRGCLGTEVSGFALEEKFKEKMEKNEPSLLQEEYNQNPKKGIHYLKIIDAAKKGDMLSMQLLMEMGSLLGQELGKIANILNPESIVIGGRMAESSELMQSSLQNALKIYALPLIAEDCKIEFKRQSDQAGLLGAGLLVLINTIFD